MGLNFDLLAFELKTICFNNFQVNNGRL